MMHIQSERVTSPIRVQGYIVEETLLELQQNLNLSRKEFNSAIESEIPISNKQLISSCKNIFNKTKKLLEKYQQEMSNAAHKNTKIDMQAILIQADSDCEITKKSMNFAFNFFEVQGEKCLQDSIEKYNVILDTKITEILLDLARESALDFRSEISKYTKQLNERYLEVCNLEIKKLTSNELYSTFKDIDSTCAVVEPLSSISKIASKVSHIKRKVFTIIDSQNSRERLLEELQISRFSIQEPINKLYEKLKADSRSLAMQIEDKSFILSTFCDDFCMTARDILNNSLEAQRKSLLEKEINLIKIEQAELSSQFVMERVQPLLKKAIEALEHLEESISCKEPLLKIKITHQKGKICAYLALLQAKRAQILLVTTRINSMHISDENLEHFTNLSKEMLFEDVLRECDIEIESLQLRCKDIFECISKKFVTRLNNLQSKARDLLTQESMDDIETFYSQSRKCLLDSSKLKNPIIYFFEKCSRFNSNVNDLESLQEEKLQNSLP